MGLAVCGQEDVSEHLNMEKGAEETTFLLRLARGFIAPVSVPR